MTREQLYHLFKWVLSYYGAIPKSEKEYENLVSALIDVYLGKHAPYPVSD